MVFRFGYFLPLALVFTGCALNRKPAPVAPRPESFGWEGKANLSLNEIVPQPHLQPPATQPTGVPWGQPPIDALLFYAKARDATVRNQPVIAIENLQRAIAIDPYRYQPRYDLGWAYVAANAADDNAISAFENAAQLEPDHLELHTELGRLYLAKSNLPEALRHLRLATQTTEYALDDGQAAVADFFLARTLKDCGYDRAALNQYTILLKRFDHPSLALEQNGELAYLLEQPDALFVQIGELLEKHGEYAQAIEAFKPAVQRSPDNFELQSRYARDLARDGQHDAALDKAVDLIVHDRATPQTLQVLHDVCADLNLPDGEVATLTKLSAARPGDLPVLFALSDTLIAQGRATEARQMLESAWKHSPGDIPLTRRLFAAQKSDNAVEPAARLLIHSLAVNSDAVHNYTPLFAELLRPGQANRLTLATLAAITVSAGDQGSKQFWISLTAANADRLAVERSALASAEQASPAFAPAFRSMLELDWSRSDWSDEQKIDDSEKLAALAKTQGNLALSFELQGRSLVNQKKISEANAAFSAAMQAGGTSPDLILAADEAKKSAGRDGAFEAALWKLISDHPLYEDAYLALFSYYANPDTGTAEQAMKVLATWLVNDPQSVTARISQVQSEIQQGMIHEPQAELSRLFADDPDDPEVFRMMRQYYSQTHRTDELIRKLEDARINRPRDTDLVGKLVVLYAEQKRNPEAIRLLDNTRSAVSDDADLLYSLTVWYDQLDQKQTAEDVLQQVVRLDPNHAGACNDLGFEWADAGKNLPRAEDLIRTAVAAEPDNESFLDSLGWVLYKRGKFDEAQKYLLQAIGPAAFPDPVVLDHLGDTQYRLSRAEDARQTWQRSLKGLGDADEERADMKQLRLQLLEKIRQVEANKPVDLKS
jgi:tetratricopeptide (TPR) repeat protein